MPFPSTWPSQTGTSRKSSRIYVDGITTDDWADNAYMFSDLVTGCRKGSVWPFNALRVFNDGTADIYVTFDGTTIHGTVRPSEKLLFEDRSESGIAVKSPSTKAAAFRIEGW
jgi:hypothetical protein